MSYFNPDINMVHPGKRTVQNTISILNIAFFANIKFRDIWKYIGVTGFEFLKIFEKSAK